MHDSMHFDPNGKCTGIGKRHLRFRCQKEISATATACSVIPHPRIHYRRSAPHDARSALHDEWCSSARLGFLGHRSTYKQSWFSSVERGEAHPGTAVRLLPLPPGFHHLHHNTPCRSSRTRPPPSGCHQEAILSAHAAIRLPHSRPAAAHTSREIHPCEREKP